LNDRNEILFYTEVLDKKFTMKRLYTVISFFLAIESNAQNGNSDTLKYTRVGSGYLMVLTQGDTVLAYLERLALKEQIPSASISAFGFLSDIKFGFFNAETKKYEEKNFSNVELAGLSGSIAWEKDKPSLHMHGVVGDRNMNSFAGHILSAVVGTGSLEIQILLQNKKLERKTDPSIGAKVLQIPTN